MTHHSYSSSGFTLIELLIVIVIISIVATVGLLSIKVNDSKRFETLANQIVNTLTLAEQEALLRPVTLGLAVHQNQLRFYEYQESINPEQSPWVTTVSAVLNTIVIPSDIYLTLKIEGEEISSSTPRIIINPGGNLTAFTLLIGKKNSAPRYRVVGEDNGNLKASALHEEE